MKIQMALQTVPCAGIPCVKDLSRSVPRTKFSRRFFLFFCSILLSLAIQLEEGFYETEKRPSSGKVHPESFMIDLHGIDMIGDPLSPQIV